MLEIPIERQSPRSQRVIGGDHAKLGASGIHRSMGREIETTQNCIIKKSVRPRELFIAYPLRDRRMAGAPPSPL